MAILPLERNRTYVEGMPLVPGDLNDFQDCIKGGKHGALTINIPIFPTQLFTGVIGQFDKVTLNGNALFLPVPRLPVGTRITAIRAKVQAGAGLVLSMNFRVRQMAGLAPSSYAILGLTAFTLAPGTVEVLTLAPAFDVTPFTEMAITIVTAAVGAQSVYMVEADIEKR